MKKIPLTQGKFAIIDDEDFELVSKFKWHVKIAQSKLFYAYATIRKGMSLPKRFIETLRVIRYKSKSGEVKTYHSKRRRIPLHWLILPPKKGYTTDHINGNGLDNRRNNLRSCLLKDNLKNRRIHKNNKCGYKGVQKVPNSKLYRARIKVNKKTIRLGRYKSLIEAARIYDLAALKYFGEFARLNFPQ